MKKIIIGSIIVFLSLVFMFNFNYSQRPTDSFVYQSPFQDGLIYLKGWVKYRYSETGSRRITTGIICELKNNDKYVIHSLMLNNKKYSTVNNKVFEINNSPMECSVGQLLEIKIALKDKRVVGIVAKPQYRTIAKFKINNLFEKYIFPTPGQVVDLNSGISPFLVFKWKFTNFNQASKISMSAVYTPSVNGESNGDNFSFRKSELKHDKRYSIFQYTLNNDRNCKFNLLKGVTSDSSVRFNTEYDSWFRTSKLSLKKAVISIK